jgi:3-methyladenine DNA glycosylase AlkD
MPQDIIAEIRRELTRQATDKPIDHRRYFKEDITLYGVSVPVVEKIAAVFYPSIKPPGKKEVFRLCEELFKSGYMEEAFIASNWSYRCAKDFTPDDFAVFERWLHKYVSNWAECDTLCNHTIGALVEKYPQFLSNLKQWAKSENRWVRRAAAVTLIIPAKRGLFLKDIFEIADILLKDPDDLVQKGYGWMLKDAAITCQQEIFDYVMKNKAAMPRTALRYAIERLPAEMKKQAMAK